MKWDSTRLVGFDSDLLHVSHLVLYHTMLYHMVHVVSATSSIIRKMFASSRLEVDS